LILAWALQQCSATALPVISTVLWVFQFFVQNIMFCLVYDHSTCANALRVCYFSASVQQAKTPKLWAAKITGFTVIIKIMK